MNKPFPVMWMTFSILSLKMLNSESYPFFGRGLGSSSGTGSLTLFEGDIMGYNPSATGDNSYSTKEKWPGGIVPYEISDSFTYTQREVILGAMRELQQKTCVHFRPKQFSDDYSIIIDNMHQGCFAFLGRKTRSDLRSINSNYDLSHMKQLVNIGSGCFIHGIVLHELMHTIGFLHEQSRTDRDSYVDIFWSNIEADAWPQFQKYNDDTLGLSYDFDSIMHYGRTHFSKNGKDTIKPKPVYAWRTIGQRDALSETDVRRVTLLYQCSAVDSEDDEELSTQYAVIHTGSECNYALLCLSGSCFILCI